jgi:hypothetical protein
MRSPRTDLKLEFKSDKQRIVKRSVSPPCKGSVSPISKTKSVRIGQIPEMSTSPPRGQSPFRDMMWNEPASSSEEEEEDEEDEEEEDEEDGVHGYQSIPEKDVVLKLLQVMEADFRCKNT